MSNEGNRSTNRQSSSRRPHGRRRYSQNQNRNNSNHKNKPNNKKQKSIELKFNVHGYGKEKQTCSYAKVLEKICLRLQQNLTSGGSNIVESIRKNKICRPAAPERKESQEIDSAKKAFDQQTLDKEYDARLKNYIRMDMDFDENWKKAFAYIYESFCTKEMQIAIKELPNYEKEIQNQPLKLLEEVKALMHTPIRARYPFMSLTENLASLINMKQNENEQLVDYLERFEQDKMIIKSQLGKNLLDNFIQNYPDYDKKSSTEQQAMKENGFEAWMAAIFLRGSNQSIYAELMKDYRKDYANQDDNYPKTVRGMVDVMRQLKPKLKTKQPNNDKNKNSNSPNKNEVNKESSFATQSKCYCCGKPGCRPKDCNIGDDIPRNEWFDRSGKIHFTETERNESAEDRQDNNSRSRGQNGRRGWSMMQIHQSAQGKVRKEPNTMKNKATKKVYLDSAATRSLFCDEELLDDVRNSKFKTEIQTNTGTGEIDKEGDVPGFRTVMFSKQAIANLLALNELCEKYHVTFDSKVENAFNVKLNDGRVMKFSCDEDGMYSHSPEEPEDKVEVRNPELKNNKSRVRSERIHAEEIRPRIRPTNNRKRKGRKKIYVEGYNRREVERAARARRMYHSLTAPDIVDLKRFIRQNIMKNCPVTTEDVTLAERIFGRDVPTLKGKSVRSKSVPIKDERIELPEELQLRNKELELAIDILYIDRSLFLVSIDRSLKFRATVPLKDRESSEIFSALDVILRHYNNEDYEIKTIHCDREFKSMMDEVADEMHINMVYASSNDHVPDIERSNRVIEERYRVAFYRLEFKMIPKVMCEHLAMRVTKNLNMFPAKEGISQHYSPQTILKKENVDYLRYCTFSFGEHVQAFDDNTKTNNNLPRTLDCIYLRPDPESPNGHKLMDLKTGQCIDRPQSALTACEMTQDIKERVEELARKQGVKSLKFRYRKREDWLPTNIDEEMDQDESSGSDDDSDYQPSESESDYSSDDGSTADSCEEEGSDDEPEDDEDNDDDDDLDDDVDEGRVADATDEGSPRRVDCNVENPNLENDNQEDNELEPEKIISEKSEDEPNQGVRKSGRSTKKPAQYNPSTGGTYLQTLERKEKIHNLRVNDIFGDRKAEYSRETGKVIARHIHHIRNLIVRKETSHATQYMLKKGLKIFGEDGVKASKAELTQMHQRICFKPELVKNLTPMERKRAMRGLMILRQKKDGTTKGRLAYNGKPTRTWISREEASSPTASQEGIFLTSTVDANERRDIMSVDIPNAYIQADVPIESGQDRITMKITGVLVDWLVEIEPETYAKYVVFENGEKTIYLIVTKAIYGMLVASVLWYKRLKSDLLTLNFKFNEYDPCIANRQVFGTQHTIRFHVDDILSSHSNPKVNDQFLDELNRLYGRLKPCTSKRGDEHEFLGMTLKYKRNGTLEIRMDSHINDFIDTCPGMKKNPGTVPTPAAKNLFSIDTTSELLSHEEKEEFHSCVAKGLFIGKRSRPDIQMPIAVLSSRVMSPNRSDLQKLVRVAKYLKGTKDLCLTLGIDDVRILKWMVDSSHAVHDDFKGHTGGCLSWGIGSPISISQKQKLNSRSSTESEIIGVDDVMDKILWTKLFLQAQGVQIQENILYQDNQSSIKLETNGKWSSGKRTRAINIRYFFVTDNVEKGNLQIEYKPSEDMVADFLTKPLQGKKFEEFRAKLMGFHGKDNSSDGILKSNFVRNRE